MSLTLAQIDHAIEWVLRDEVIRVGYWPTQRIFITNSDEAGYQAALQAKLDAKEALIEIFGTANYTDRSQLKENNIIIERLDPSPGTVGFAFPFHFVRQPDFSFKKYQTQEGTWNLDYEIRFVCDDVTLDRAITKIMINAFKQRKFIYGINDDLTNLEEGFWFTMQGPAVDLSAEDFIERVYRFQAVDVELGDEVEVASIPMVEQIAFIPNVAKDLESAQFPVDSADIIIPITTSGEYFKSLVDFTAMYARMDRINIYAQKTSPIALTPIRGTIGVNHGTTFTPWKGFKKVLAADYIDSTFDRSLAKHFQTTCFSFTFVIMETPAAAIDIAGLVDGVSDFRIRGDANGIYVKANSLVERVLANRNFKAFSIYVINKIQSNILELWEDGAMIGQITIDVPVGVTAGRIFELNVNNSGPIGTSQLGALGFSSYGFGFPGSKVKEWSGAVKNYFSKLGYQ